MENSILNQPWNGSDKYVHMFHQNDIEYDDINIKKLEHNILLSQIAQIPNWETNLHRLGLMF